MQKTMCEGSDRTKQIQTFFNEEFSKSVKIQFVLSADENPDGGNENNSQKNTSQKRNEIMNDPAVKTILLGLDATITSIEEE